MAAGKERGLRLEAGEARAWFLPESLQKERTRTIPDHGTSYFQSCEIIHLCCVKPLNLCEFVTAGSSSKCCCCYTAC